MIDPAKHVVWPSERCFFAMLDTRGVRRSWRGVNDEQLGYLFEDVLPVPIEQVHAIYHPLGRHEVLACGVPRERLEQDLPADAERLTPESVPAHLSCDLDPRALNLLTGEFTPANVRVASRRRSFLAAGACLVVALLLGIGMERRRAHAEAAVETYRLAQDDLLDRALGPAAPGIPKVQRVAALVGEKRRLEWTRGQRPTATPADVSTTFARILERWPSEVVWVDALNVAKNAVTVRGFAEQTSVADRIATALRGLEGFDLEAPELRRTPDGVRFTVRLRPTKGAP